MSSSSLSIAETAHAIAVLFAYSTHPRGNVNITIDCLSPRGVIVPTLRMRVLGKFAPLLFSVAPGKCPAPDGSRATNSPKLYHGTSENSHLRSPGRSRPSGSPQTSQVSALPCCLFQGIVERALPPSRVLPGMMVGHAGV